MTLLLVLMHTASASASLPPLVRADQPCATALLLPHVLPSPDPLPALPPGDSADKDDREAIDGVLSSRRSANFAVKWGSSGGVDEDAVFELLDALEIAWAVQIDQMEHPGPVGTDRYLLNVYIEDTGLTWTSGSHSFELRGSGASGYYYTDPDGYPMLVMSRGSLADVDYAAMVAAHEFFHAVQAGLGSYAYSGRGAWYWEATATWMSAEVFPDVPDYAIFLFGYALLPHLPVDFFDYPDTGALQEYHQYGAFIVPRYLTEHVADWTVVRDSWLLPDPGGDPVAALDAALAAWDTSLAEEMVSIASYNATWDYVDGDVYAANVETYAPYYSGGDHAVATHSGTGSGGWRDIATADLPRAYGYNLVAWQQPPAGSLTIQLQVDATGSTGSAAQWSAQVVVEQADGPTYLPVDLSEGAGELVVDATGDAIWLAVAVTSDERDEDESFAWRYSLGTGDGGGDPSDDTGQPVDVERPVATSCGCGSAGGGAWLLALLGPLLLGARRRG